MAYCTFYERPICSLCCSLEPHCRDFCKRDWKLPPETVDAQAGSVKLHRVSPRLGKRFWQIAMVFLLLLFLTGLFLFAGGWAGNLEDLTTITALFLGAAPLMALIASWAVMANERRQLTEENLLGALRRLGQTQQELAVRQRLAAVGEVAATISHELRNPLGTISSSVEVLSRNPALSGDAEEDVQRIRRSISRCSRIIDILLDFGRDGTHETVSIELRPWLMALLDEHSLGAEVTLNVPADTHLRCDPARLQFAIRNLIENAWQAAKSVQTPDHQPRVVLSVLEDDDFGIIEIEDNGPGLSPEIRARAFDPLVTTKASGFGLGLTLVRRVAQMHGGDAWIEHTSPHGTTMRLSIAQTT